MAAVGKNMTLVSLLDSSTVFPKLEARDKGQVLEDMIGSLKKQVSQQQLELIRKAVFERESIMSTGVGKGLAIPHGKVKDLEQNLASFAILDQPIDYEAIDGNPVDMIFLLVAPEAQNSVHIKLLSRISRMLNNKDFRDQLKACSSSEELIQSFKEEETKHFGA